MKCMLCEQEGLDLDPQTHVTVPAIQYWEGGDTSCWPDDLLVNWFREIDLKKLSDRKNKPDTHLHMYTHKREDGG